MNRNEDLEKELEEVPDDLDEAKKDVADIQWKAERDVTSHVDNAKELYPITTFLRDIANQIDIIYTEYIHKSQTMLSEEDKDRIDRWVDDLIYNKSEYEYWRRLASNRLSEYEHIFRNGGDIDVEISMRVFKDRERLVDSQDDLEEMIDDFIEHIKSILFQLKVARGQVLADVLSVSEDDEETQQYYVQSYYRRRRR